MTILVTGATGSVGRKVVDHLLARGATAVRALTADPARAALPAGVEVVRGYVRRVETMPAALAGVHRMYLTSAPETAVEVTRLAREAGVRHIVDLSGEPESWWGGVTAAVEGCGVPWTHLWPGDFMENALIWAAQIRERGEVREPNPDLASAPVAMDDVAAVAAAALLDDGHAGRAYSLTGPQVLTRGELLTQVGEAFGRGVRFVTVSRDEAVRVLAPEMGENAGWYVDNVLLAAGATPPVTRTVEEVTGRAATTFARWAADHAEDFR